MRLMRKRTKSSDSPFNTSKISCPYEGDDHHGQPHERAIMRNSLKMNHKARKIVAFLTFLIGIMTLVAIFDRETESITAATSASSVKAASKKAHVMVFQGDTLSRPEWIDLCAGGFVKKIAQNLLEGKDVNVIQIGAHVGFEENDPLAKGLARLLDVVTTLHNNDNDNKNDDNNGNGIGKDNGKGADNDNGHESHSTDLLNSDTNKDKSSKFSAQIRKNFHWTFVEPSPPNFKRLEENLRSHSTMCDMKGINAGIVPDSMKEADATEMIFYSVKDTVDPVTGYDSLTGLTLPHLITQLSTFDKDTLRKKEDMFSTRPKYRDKGLKFYDYIVETPVVTKSLSSVIKESLQLNDKKDSGTDMKAHLVLIDTEGFDCKIIKGISPSSKFLPEFLIFENMNCKKEEISEAEVHLIKMGYQIFHHVENTVAIKSGEQ
jgi:hypothetical protein